MKKLIACAALVLIAGSTLTSCMDDADEIQVIEVKQGSTGSGGGDGDGGGNDEPPGGG